MGRGKVKLRVSDWKGTHEEEIDFEALCRTPKKELLKIGKIPVKEGRYIISTRKSFIDLAFYSENPERYNNDINALMHDIKYIITDERYEDQYVEFTYTNSKKIRKMSQIHFLINMVLWRGYFALGIPVNKENTFMPKTFSNKAYQTFLNEKFIEPYKHLCTHNQMSQILCGMYDDCMTLCVKTGILLGLSFSLHEMITAWDAIPELDELCHTKIPKTMQLSEAEKFLASQSRRMREIFMQDELLDDTSIKAMLRAGVLNEKQLREAFINIGMKPNLAGTTVPIYSDTNFTTQGLSDIRSYYVDAIGGRKAAVLALSIADGGYFSRLAAKLASDITTNPDPEYNCGSEHYYEMTISDRNDLHKMHGRWYLTEHNTLRQLIDTDYEVIGQTLQFRTPTTCASKNGICKICYSHLYNQNYGLNIGVLSALKIGEKNYQATMSAKHALNTNSDKLNFTSEFEDYFDMYDGFRIVLKSDIEEVEVMELLINVHVIKRDKDIDDLENNEFIPEFYLHNTDSGERILIKDNEGSNFYMGEKIFHTIISKRKRGEFDEDGFISIPLKTIAPAEYRDYEEDMVTSTDDDEEEVVSSSDDVFFVRLENSELTKPLKDLKAFIEKGKVVNVNNISEFITSTRHMMEAGSIEIESVHIENLLRNLIRDKNDITKIPDWSKEDVDYTITSIHNAILMSGSVLNSLTFERLGNQLKNPLTYNKTDVSFTDRLYILD